MKRSSYTYEFTNGTFTITKGIFTKYDWHVSVRLKNGFINLNKCVFLTKKNAKQTTEELLKKYNLL